MDYIGHENPQNGVVCLLRVSFDLENGPFWSWRPTGSIGKVLTDVQVNFFAKIRSEFRITKKDGEQ